MQTLMVSPFRKTPRHPLLLVTGLFTTALISSNFFGVNLSPVSAQTPSETTNQAQDEDDETALPNQFTPNPLLEKLITDPLLPTLSPNQSLSETQRQSLSNALEQLHLEAEDLWRRGKIWEAFTLWNRELQLRRYLGTAAEIDALTRVGRVARIENQPLQLKWVTERLQIIQAELLSATQIDVLQLQALAIAFQEVRAKNPAIEVYQQLLTLARAQGNTTAEMAMIKAMGDWYLQWLDYSNAGIIYEQLLDLQQTYIPVSPEPILNNPQGNRPPEPPQIQSLRTLARIYEQQGKPLEAIAAQERLVDFYLTQQNLLKVPQLKLEIGQNYQELGQYRLAGQYYQETYSLALPIEQFAIASVALEKLAGLYRSQDKMEAALQIYQAQLAVEQRSYNVYGMMTTYDQIGEVFLALRAYPQALNAFKQGQELSRLLGGYHPEYFSDKINRLNRRIER